MLWRPFDRWKQQWNARKTIRFIKQKVDYIVTDTTENDYQYLMRYYPELQSKPWKDFFYYPLDIILGKELMNSEVCGNSIMIGNSASGTNNHEYVMRILSKLDIGSRRVIVPLSYSGKKGYVDHVLQSGRLLLGENFSPLLDFMPLDEYNRLQSDVSVALFGNWRQEAIGNIIVALYLGAKVFLSHVNPVYEWAQSHGLTVYELEKLSQKELESYFAENPQSYEEEAEDYSRFLYQLEQKKDITENERKAYIGIYRMVHQIEREDGAAVGAVVNTGAELQFSTLLAASRSRRTSHMDWKVSDDTGLTQEVRLSENNISEQISVGMAKEILTDVSEDTESRDAYYQECLQQMREAVETEPGAAQMLERGEVNTSTSNLLAAQALLEDPAELFSDLQRYRKKYNKEKEIPVAATGEGPAGTEASGLWEQLDQQNFADDYRTMLQDALQETETISLEQAESHLDVKQLQLVHKQLRLAGNLQNRQEYFLPMYLGDQLAGVHLTLQQGTGETSAVDIRVDAGDEQLEAHLQVNGEHIEGYLVGNTTEEVTKLEKTSDIFLEWIQTDTSADWKAEKLSVVSSRDMTRMAAGETQNAETIESRADAAQLYRLAKGFLQAVADSSGK